MGGDYPTRGQREASDIIKAAIDQGWQPKVAAGNHLRLIPPSPEGVPVGISNTPSDHNFRRQIIRQMKRSGFVWPPPEKVKSRGHRLHEVLGTFNNQEEDMTTAIEETPAALEQEGWYPITLPDIAEGYSLNDEGDVRSPAGTVLAQQLLGNQLWISLKRTDKSGSRAFRVDRLMLSVRVGDPLKDDARPKHIDGDSLNCKLDNLRWPTDCDVEVAHPPVEEVVPDPEPEAEPEVDVPVIAEDVAPEPKKKRTYKKRAPKAAPSGGVLLTQSEVDKVQMDRIYTYKGVEVRVHADGTVDELPYGDAMALATILLRVEQTNKLMGIE